MLPPHTGIAEGRGGEGRGGLGLTREKLVWLRHIATMHVDNQLATLFIVSDSCVLLLMREIEQITARSPMVGTPIILVQRPISLGLIKE